PDREVGNDLTGMCARMFFNASSREYIVLLDFPTGLIRNVFKNRATRIASVFGSTFEGSCSPQVSHSDNSGTKSLGENRSLGHASRTSTISMARATLKSSSMISTLRLENGDIMCPCL